MVAVKIAMAVVVVAVLVVLAVVKAVLVCLFALVQPCSECILYGTVRLRCGAGYSDH